MVQRKVKGCYVRGDVVALEQGSCHESEVLVRYESVATK